MLSILLLSAMSSPYNSSIPVGYVPRGSYIQSSRQIRVTLYCYAQKVNGSWIPASYDLTSSGFITLANIDEVLVGTPAGSSLVQPKVPGGSYTASCKDIRLVLTAQCKKIDGSWTWSSLDISQGVTGDIGNANGNLEMKPF